MKFLKYSITTLLFFAAFHSLAQEAIGTNNPNPQAALHIASPNKGLLIPKLALSNATTFIGSGTDAQSDTGMLVFNTNTDTSDTGLNGSGFYYWSTNFWEKLSDLTELNEKTTHVPLWVSNTNGGVYATHDIVSQSGVLYKNRTGTNTDTAPSADTTNWEALGDTSIPLWKSNTNGRVYAINDVINHNGILYKNLTGVNTDTSPEIDLSNWEIQGVIKTKSITGEFTKEGDILRGVGLEAVTGGTVIDIAQNGPVNNYENAFDGDRSTFANAAGASYSKHTYVLPNSLNIKKVKIDYGTAQGDPASLIIRLTDNADVSLGEIVPPTLTHPNRQHLSYEVDVDNVERIYLHDFSGSRLVLYEVELYTTEASIAIPNAQIGEIVYVDGYGYAEVLTNVNQDITLRLVAVTETTEVPLWKSNTNGGVYAINDVINHNGILYKNTTGTNTDFPPNLDGANWEAIGGGDIVPLWKSSTNGGVYAINDVINHNGILYKNITGTNTDFPPTIDGANWELLDSNLWENDLANTRIQLKNLSDGTARPANNGVFVKDTGNVGVGTNSPASPLDVVGETNIGSGPFRTTNHLSIDHNGSNGTGYIVSNGSAGSNLEFHTALGGTESVALKLDPNKNATITGNIYSDTFSTAWITNSNGGVYAINDIIIYDGTFYKNTTGVNTDFAPNLDAVNWVNYIERYFTEVSFTQALYNLVGGNVNQTLPYDSVDVSIGGAGSWFDITTHRFTPQRAGWWKIAASFDIYRVANQATTIRMLKNGTPISNTSGIGLINATTTREVYLNGSTDYIEVVTFGSSANTRSQDQGEAYFQARWISE